MPEAVRGVVSQRCLDGILETYDNFAISAMIIIFVSKLCDFSYQYLCFLEIALQAEHP